MAKAKKKSPGRKRPSNQKLMSAKQADKKNRELSPEHAFQDRRSNRTYELCYQYHLDEKFADSLIGQSLTLAKTLEAIKNERIKRDNKRITIKLRDGRTLYTTQRNLKSYIEEYRLTAKSAPKHILNAVEFLEGRIGGKIKDKCKLDPINFIRYLINIDDNIKRTYSRDSDRIAPYVAWIKRGRPPEKRDDETNEKIRDLYEKGKSYMYIARKTGLSKRQVEYRIKNKI